MKVIDDKVSRIVLGVIRKAVESGEDVRISGFGMFYPKRCQCHCPNCRHVEIAFKGSIRLKEALNNDR